MGRGETVARLLARSWDPDPPAPDVSAAELEAAASTLLESGCGALAWRRLRGTSLADSPVGSTFHDAFRLHFLRAAVNEQDTRDWFMRFASAGLDPILCKGWSAARLYPETALRPYGDVDLFVRPASHARAQAILDAGVCPVDIDHDDMAGLDEDELHAHSRVVSLDGATIRILGPEHQLRTLALHQLRHGLWRPLWLLDVAILLESLPPGFDWDLALRGPRHAREGIECVAGLAHRLLGARIEGLPLSERSRTLPRWLMPAVMAAWPRLKSHYYDGTPLAARLLKPRTLLAAIRQRWPSPIQATVDRGAPFNDWPRWPWQVADCAIRFGGFLLRLPSTLRETVGAQAISSAEDARELDTGKE
jgi:hypothetical protein